MDAPLRILEGQISQVVGTNPLQLTKQMLQFPPQIFSFKNSTDINLKCKFRYPFILYQTDTTNDLMVIELPSLTLSIAKPPFVLRKELFVARRVLSSEAKPEFITQRGSGLLRFGDNTILQEISLGLIPINQFEHLVIKRHLKLGLIAGAIQFKSNYITICDEELSRKFILNLNPENLKGKFAEVICRKLRFHTVGSQGSGVKTNGASLFLRRYHIPSDILKKIFNYIHPVKLKPLKLTCRAWNHALSDRIPSQLVALTTGYTCVGETKPERRVLFAESRNGKSVYHLNRHILRTFSLEDGRMLCTRFFEDKIEKVRTTEKYLALKKENHNEIELLDPETLGTVHTLTFHCGYTNSITYKIYGKYIFGTAPHYFLVDLNNLPKDPVKPLQCLLTANATTTIHDNLLAVIKNNKLQLIQIENQEALLEMEVPLI